MSGYKGIANDPKHNTAGFRQHPENIGNGRPKKIYTILKAKGYSADDIKASFGELAFYTLDELKKVHHDETKPIITRIVANQFYLALSKGDWGKIKEILQHTIGMPKQTVDVKEQNPITEIKVMEVKNG